MSMNTHTDTTDILIHMYVLCMCIFGTISKSLPPESANITVKAAMDDIVMRSIYIVD